jgi:phosphorylase/glycogen(starch) synthase
MNQQADFIFETSWEICNKIGGIYTVLSTKAKSIVNKYNENYVLIGPDVWKETEDNPDFLEDKDLFVDWKLNGKNKDLKIRTGRWNIEGNPKVILIDFTNFFSKKDEIFTKLWKQNQLDSLYGKWDYIEPAIFGYVVGLLIESFSEYYLQQKKVVAHFHEWMTGTAVLYLKENVPQIATVFTTHATVIGRSIAGNGLPLYDNLESYDAEELANRFQVKSKHSLEKLSALNADVFTTVSSITARECEQFFGKKPDVITINGFEEKFVPDGDEFMLKRKNARKKALEIASKLKGRNLPEDSLLLINSGRYEFRNKGIDIFIDALEKLKNDEEIKREIVAFITVPAAHHEAYKLFLEENAEIENPFLTHHIHNSENDPVLNHAYAKQLHHGDSKVTLVFVPAYLNGKDKVVNMQYYDFLIGFDLSVFPSYYEPWGYTPLESVAFKIPTITTSYAGFGNWAKSNFSLKENSVRVIERKEDGDKDASLEIYKGIKEFEKLTDVSKIENETETVFEKVLWNQLSENYFEAWDLAAHKAFGRIPEKPLFKKTKNLKVEATIKNNAPEWKKILVRPVLPKQLRPLKELAYNLWWSWNTRATNLFASIKPEKWEDFEQNPVRLIETLSIDDVNRLANDKAFMAELSLVYSDFKNYMSEKMEEPNGKVAYFSMEYGLHTSLKIYSGGLGILAGDYLKQASDSNKNLFGVGLLYRFGYFKQVLSQNGDQIADFHAQKFTQLPIIPVRDNNGNGVVVKIALPGRAVSAKVWQVNVGRIKLYLLDTDIKNNSVEDQKITHQLYGGDNENRLKQEMILGIGGIRLINSLGLNPDIFHNNEGHAAFSGLERIRNLIDDLGLDFQLAKEIVRSTTLFTTHTPVPAGHDSFEEHLLRAYLPHFCESFQISWNDFVGMGRFFANDQSENFSMSVLATNLSQEVNGVSEIHGRVSREMFKALYPGYFANELHIGHVTNGVHYFTWTSAVWQELYANVFGKNFEKHQSNAAAWEKIKSVDDEIIWNKRIQLKTILIEEVKKKLRKDLTAKAENPKVIVNMLSKLDENALIIGFARRFATYKRAHLLFTNLERLDAIINKKNKPVFFFFAGKAHPNDKAGQDLIKRIVEISKMPRFIGKIIFIDNYDMTIGKLLTSSVDIWLNTPTRPLEASGTSGEKAVMNGVVNFSVLDGWWAEGYTPGAGWAVEENRTYENQYFQDELDAEIIYSTLENKISKIYYKQKENGVSHKWVSHIKKTISEIAPHFTMQRMLDDYYAKFYGKLFQRKDLVFENNFEKARELLNWKNKINQAWANISVDQMIVPDVEKGAVEFGTSFHAEIIMNIPGLNCEDIGIEILVGNKENEVVETLGFKQELCGENIDQGKAKYICDFPLKNTGVYDYTFRVFPKHKLLVHRMDFPLVKWV